MQTQRSFPQALDSPAEDENFPLACLKSRASCVRIQTTLPVQCTNTALAVGKRLPPQPTHRLPPDDDGAQIAIILFFSDALSEAQ